MKKYFAFENVKGSWLTSLAGLAAIIVSFVLLFVKNGFGWQEATAGLMTGFPLLGLKDPGFITHKRSQDEHR